MNPETYAADITLSEEQLQDWSALCEWLEACPYNASYRPPYKHLFVRAAWYPMHRHSREKHARAKRLEAERKALDLVYWATGFGWRLRKDYQAKLDILKQRQSDAAAT